MSRVGILFLLIAVSLVCIGIVITFSASAPHAYEYLNRTTYFLWRELIACGLGCVALLIFYRMGPKTLERFSRIIFLGAVFSLFLVYLPSLGHSSGGAKRWLSIFGVTVQPVEFLKVAFCVYFADYLSRKSRLIERGNVSVFLTPLMFLMAVSGILLLQPDLGSVIILFLITAIMFFLAGIGWRYIFSLAGVGLAGLAVAVIAEPYRFKRVISFLDPWQDPKGAGFQIIQSFLALGRGGITGVGLGESTQKLFYLPQSYSDFIFAILGEELGIIGTGVTLLLFLGLLITGLILASRETTLFRKLLVCSLVYLITSQAVINILVVTGLVPTKGLALPFISYGGTALLANMSAVGIVLGVDRKRTSS